MLDTKGNALRKCTHNTGAHTLHFPNNWPCLCWLSFLINCTACFSRFIERLPRLLPLSICHVSLWWVFLSLCSALILRRIYTLSANRQNPVCLWKRARDERRGDVRAMRWEAFQALPPQRLKTSEASLQSCAGLCERSHLHQRWSCSICLAKTDMWLTECRVREHYWLQP